MTRFRAHSFPTLFIHFLSSRVFPSSLGRLTSTRAPVPFNSQDHQCSPDPLSFLFRRGSVLSPPNSCPYRAVSTSGDSIWSGIGTRIFLRRWRWWRVVVIPQKISVLGQIANCVRQFDTYVRTNNSCLFSVEPLAQPMDLSKATGLKRVVLACRSADPKWIIVTLRSITDDHKHLQ